MIGLTSLVEKSIKLRQDHNVNITLLAACPNSDAVLEAAVKAAAANNSVMLFAATLNQVDRAGGYTGWTQEKFVSQMRFYAHKYNCHDWLYACLDHGGPWLKDQHTLNNLSFQQTMMEVKESLSASIRAGYSLLHIDPTVDRSLSPGEPPPLNTVIARTVELIEYSEAERKRLRLPQIAYEVGTEEVNGGLVAFDSFEYFLNHLRSELEGRGLSQAWPCFVVAQVGTDIHTTVFNQTAAERIYAIASPLGSLAKGHYTDWVSNPEAYPVAGMGGANVGPEFTAKEYIALEDLEKKEQALTLNHGYIRNKSHFTAVLTLAVVESGRWKKWLQPEEKGRDFKELSPERRRWLALTGARYMWTHPEVMTARETLYNNLQQVMEDPHQYVVDCIVRSMDHYIIRFNLINSVALFEE